MRILISGFYTEDYRLINEAEYQYDFETIAVELLDLKSPNPTGKKLEISNFLTAIPGIFNIMLLIRKPEHEPDVYQTVGHYKVMLYPSNSFQIKMRLDQYGVPEAKVWINNHEYLFYGSVGDSIITVTGKYPNTITRWKDEKGKDAGNFLMKQYQKLPLLESFLKDFTKFSEERLQQSDAPGKLLEYLQGYEIQILPGEDVHAYYSRLFNLLCSAFFNLDSNGLMSVKESNNVTEFINSTIRDGKIFV